MLQFSLSTLKFSSREFFSVWDGSGPKQKSGFRVDRSGFSQSHNPTGLTLRASPAAAASSQPPLWKIHGGALGITVLDRDLRAGPEVASR